MPAAACVSLAMLALGPVHSAEDLLSTSSYRTDRLVTIPVDSFPDSLLTDGASGLDLIPVRSADVTELVMAARADGGWIAMDTLVSTGMFNDAKAWAYWERDRRQVVLASQVPFRTLTFFSVWQTGTNGFELVDEYTEDPSEDALQETLSLLDSGRVEEASSLLFCVLYPDWYFNGEEMAANFLRASSREARRLAGAGDWRGALEVYLCAGDAYEQCGLDSLWFLDAGGFERYGNPVGVWLDDRELVGILEHLASVASEAGNDTIACSAARAAASLPMN